MFGPDGVVGPGTVGTLVPSTQVPVVVSCVGTGLPIESSPECPCFGAVTWP